jgi:hypothetical protein
MYASDWDFSTLTVIWVPWTAPMQSYHYNSTHRVKLVGFAQFKNSEQMKGKRKLHSIEPTLLTWFYLSEYPNMGKSFFSSQAPVLSAYKKKVASSKKLWNKILKLLMINHINLKNINSKYFIFSATQKWQSFFLCISKFILFPIDILHVWYTSLVRSWFIFQNFLGLTNIIFIFKKKIKSLMSMCTKSSLPNTPLSLGWHPLHYLLPTSFAK